MTRILSTICIHRDIADVFDFLATPKNWPEWHPASISVAGSTDHSLAIGEEVTEEFLAAGRRERRCGERPPERHRTSGGSKVQHPKRRQRSPIARVRKQG
jgi:hypothetical protein